MLTLQWLRTFTVDRSEVPFYLRKKVLEEALAVQVRSVSLRAVHRIVVNELRDDRIVPRLQQYVQSLPLLTALDLRGGYLGIFSDGLFSDFLCDIVQTHPRLQRLYLPEYSAFPQSVLDRYRQLEELDVSGCTTITNVDCCATTLRVLYADRCYGLTSAGLQKATKLEVLHVKGCEAITSVAPFAHCLLELNASFGCGIGSDALTKCRRLQVLDGRCNRKIRTLQPFAGELRELYATGPASELGDESLVDATGLVKLCVEKNTRVTRLSPFSSTLIELDAAGDCGIDDAALETAASLVCLNGSANPRIQHVASTLLELDATDGSGIGDAALTHATKIVRLNCSNNKRIVTIAPFRSSLRHLVAQKDSALADTGLPSTPNLVTFDCSNNPKITTIAFCLNSLEELRAEGERCGMQGDEIATAPQLRVVVQIENDKITVRHVEHFSLLLSNFDRVFIRVPPKLLLSARTAIAANSTTVAPMQCSKNEKKAITISMKVKKVVSSCLLS